jgi:hypothetical protein
MEVLMTTKFDVDLVPHIEKYAAYVYRVTITFKDGITKKIYIGAHGSEKKRVSIYDPYDFSSEDEEFLEDLRNPDNHVYFEIVMKGTCYDMFDLENQMLEKVDAGNPENKLYYNNSNGGSRFTSQSAAIEAFIDSLVEKCDNGEFDKYKQELPVEYIEEQGNEHGRVQIRTDDEEVADPEYCKGIADIIDFRPNKGDTSFLPPCLAFGGWGPKKDGIMWIDGTQRYTAVGMSKRGKTVWTYVLPKKEYKKIAGKISEITEAMIDLAYLRNPLTDAPLPMKPAELAKRVFERSKSLGDIESDRQYRFLSKQNRVGDGAKKIIADAVNLWKNAVAAKKVSPNHHYHTNKSLEGKAIIKKKREEVEKAYPNDIVWVYSTANFGPQMIFGLIQEPEFLGKKDNNGNQIKYPTVLVNGEGTIIRPVLYHSNTDYQDEWEKGKGEVVKQLLKDLADKYGYKVAPYDLFSLIAPMVISKATK